MLHIVMGISGSGKTTASGYLSKKLNAEIINTDDLHSMLFPSGERTETGDFTPEQLSEIYRSLRPLAYYLCKIAPEKDFIFEGNFRFKSQRDFITKLLDKENLPYSILYIELNDENIAKERITNRYEKEGAPDTYEDYLKVRRVFEYPQNAYKVDNSGDPNDLFRQLDKYIDQLE